MKYDIDFLATVCNAAGLSAYHFIERRMTPLPKELARVVLPRDAFDSHLDESGVTLDGEKEVKNLKKTGFKFIYFVGFIIFLIIVLLNYHLNDISDVELPKTFRPCIKSLQIGMYRRLWFLP